MKRDYKISRAFKVPTELLTEAHDICKANGVKLSTVVRRYASHVVLTDGRDLNAESDQKHSQLNVRMPFTLTHSFADICRRKQCGQAQAITNLLKRICEAGAVPGPLLEEEVDLREYIERERARLDVLERQLRK